MPHAMQSRFYSAAGAGVFALCCTLLFSSSPAAAAKAATAAPTKQACGEITVSAAASLTNAFTEMKTIFEATHPDCRVHLNFAASNPLLKQMEEGALVDVFASADQETMDKAAAARVIDPATRTNFARNSLVLIVPTDGKKPAALNGLRGLERIAVGNPDVVPAGRYTREALTTAALWEPLQAQLVPGNSVRQVLEYVARGEVDAGFVYASDARQRADNVDVIMTVGGHKPMLYPVAVAVTGKNPELGHKFIRDILSFQGQKIMAKYGFSAP